MEDLLLNIIKESATYKLPNLKQTAQEAHDLLCCQNTTFRSPSHELRTACFAPLKIALESKRNKLVTLAVTGLNKIIRDERFQAGTEPEDDSLWLPSQLLLATTSLLSQCEDTQVHILRVVLNLACSPSWALNGRLVILIISRCGEAYDTGTQPIRAAAQAAASQTLTAFCTFLDEECQEILLQRQKHKNSGSSAEMVYTKTSAVAYFNEAIPVMQYICSRLEETKLSTKSNDTIIFLLECLLTLVNTLPHTVNANGHFITFLWQRFCPALLSLLGPPGDSIDQGLSTNQCKIVYSIGIQVVRLVGRERALRPVLEALFHRMLLLPSSAKRLEPLRAAKELLRSSARLADLLLLSGPIKCHAGDDMAILRLIMDSIEESSQCSEPNVILASVQCVTALLGSLEALCRGEGIDQEGTEITNIRYPTLEEADYTGPLTYQSLARLPKPYRDIVANMKSQSDSDSSGIEGNIHTAGESDTDCSDATEGPEEFGSQSDDSIMDDKSFLTNQQLKNIHKLPKALNLGRTGVEERNTDVERHNAKHFVKTLQNILLPKLLSLVSSIQVDEVLQEFASKCCQHNLAQNYEISTIMNADGIYLATYSALLLDLKLIQSGHYDENKKEEKIPITEAQFVEEIHGSGILVYVSATWLCELYQNVLAKSLLITAGYNPNNNSPQPPLINLLTDIGGLSSSQILTEWQRLQKVYGTPDKIPEVDAGIKLSRRVLTCCWASVILVLKNPLDEKPKLNGASSTLSRFVARRERLKHQKLVYDDIITACLEGLHKAASLSNTLKLHSRSSSILALLSSSCKINGPNLSASHALSLDVLLSKGLALGSLNAACWPHVFNACVSVAYLEHILFSKTSSTQMLMVAQNTQNNIVTSTTTNGITDIDYNNLKTDEETCIDIYNFLQSTCYSQSTVTTHNDTTITEIIERSGANSTQGHGQLKGVHAAKVCCVLSQKSDELFHSAALRLSVPGFCSFITELCKASHTQLFAKTDELPRHKKKWWKKELEARQKPPPTLLLHRIGEVTLKCVKSGRPLIHIMKVWAIVSRHLIQAASHKDRTVSKKAIGCIHDIVMTLLNDQNELAYFHFNESLIKPFEDLLCLELCDVDVQDQIVACLCEFVEANTSELCSGWRPLFGTLRIANPRNNATAIMEVFRIFLSTDNTLVFANAALDYILCLLSHVKNSNIDDTQEPNINLAAVRKVNNERKPLNLLEKDCNSFEDKLTNEEIDFCLECLKLLQNCSAILSMMYNMPNCPTFNLTHRLTLDHEAQLVDPVIQNVEFNLSDLAEFNNYKILSTKLEIEKCKEDNMSLMKMDKQSGVLRIWYILLEGLCSAAITSVPKNQPIVVKTLFMLLRDLMTNPGINFGLYCVNHLLLPMVQNWLRQNTKISKNEDLWKNFKHCCGLSCELVVEYIIHLQECTIGTTSAEKKDIIKENPSVNLALKQLLLIVNECIAQKCENIARLGASCMRHIILSVGRMLTLYQWEILVVAFHRACVISLHPLQQLVQAFKENSDSFYGDLAVVKVAARKDTTVQENQRLYELAQQVFLMKTQNNCSKCEKKSCNCDSNINEQTIDDRSYVFLLYPLEAVRLINSELYAVRVPFQNLVVGILAHQMLIQTISSTLLQNLNHISPILNILQINSFSLRGILTHINAKHVDILLKCLEISCTRSKDFDLRPGLKFLTQKVGNLNKSANLYTQANTSEIVQIIVLIELCLDGIDKYSIAPRDLKELLAKEGSVKCLTDIDYIHQFLRQLLMKWEYLCETYIKLTTNLPEINGSNASSESDLSCSKEQLNNSEGQPFKKGKPFKLVDFKNEYDSFCSSTDSESYLEKDALPSVQNDDDNVFIPNANKEHQVAPKPKLKQSISLDEVASKKNRIKCDNLSSTDDETNEIAANYTKYIYNKYKIELNSIKYDTNTLLQIRKSTFSSDNIKTITTNPCEEDVNKYVPINKSFDMNKGKISNVGNGGSTPNIPFSSEMPPQQPIPNEIQQQRAVSIFKDVEVCKSSKVETIEACLELLNSLSIEKLSPLATVLKNGTLMLLATKHEKVKIATENLLQRMNISYIDHDNL